MAWASVRLSVCPSVTPWHCINNGDTQNNEIFTIGWDSSFSWQNFVPQGAGVSLERGRQRGYSPKRRYFAIIGSLSVKTVADRYITSTDDKLFRFINIDDLKRPWTPAPPSKRGLLVIFSQFLNAAHILTLNCDEMAGDRPRQPANEIFAIEC